MSVNTSLQSIERQTAVILDHLKDYGSLRALMITDMTSEDKHFGLDEQPVWMTLIYYIRDFILANISNLNLHILYSWDPKKEVREAIGDEFTKINEVAQRVLAEPEFTEAQEDSLKKIKKNLEDIEPYLTGGKYFNDDELWPMLDWYIGYTPVSNELQSSLDSTVCVLNESLRKFDEMKSVCPDIQRVVRGHLARMEVRQLHKDAVLEEVIRIVEDESNKQVPRQPRCIDSVFQFLSKKLSETSRSQTFELVLGLLEKVSLEIKKFPSRRDPTVDIKRHTELLIEEGFSSWLALIKKKKDLNAFGEMQSLYDYYSIVIKDLTEKKDSWERLLDKELKDFLRTYPFREGIFVEEDFVSFGVSVSKFYQNFPDAQFDEKMGQTFQQLIKQFEMLGKAKIQKSDDLNSLEKSMEELIATLQNLEALPNLSDANTESISQIMIDAREIFVKKICSFDFVSGNKLNSLIDSLGLEEEGPFLRSWHAIKELNSKDVYNLQEVTGFLRGVLENFELMESPDRMSEEKLMLLRSQTILLTDIADKLEWVQMGEGDLVQVNLAIPEHFNCVSSIRSLLRDIPGKLGYDPIELDLEVEADLDRDEAFARSLQSQNGS